VEKKILIVDDDKTIVDLLSIWLKTNGYEVITAFGSSEALAMTSQEKPDLILLDNHMPMISGFSIIGKLKGFSETSMIPIIIITGSPSSHMSDLALELGATDLLGKPFNFDEMLSKIKKALAQN
jgi:two-component system response regulator VicR